MKRKHSVEQIIRILGEVEKSGLKISDACRPHQITDQTYYRWKRKYGGMEVSEARRLKELEEVNLRLKRLVADQALDIQIRKEVNSKNGKPHAEEVGRGDGGRHGAQWAEPGMPSGWVGAIECLLPEGTIGCWTCEGWARGGGLAGVAVSWLQEGDGHPAGGARAKDINPKRVARVRRERGLMASRKGGKRRRLAPREEVRRSASRANEVWSYDFISDATAEGRNVRILSVIDEYTRECLVLRGERSFPARKVIEVLEEAMGCLGRSPENLRSDNGPEFVARMVQRWLEKSGIRACYIKPGAPWENGHVESFHAQLRAELLDRELYLEMEEVHASLEVWREKYNFKRPHGSLGN